MANALVIFGVCFVWEMGAVYYTKLAAHARKDTRGYAGVFVTSGAMAALGLWGLRLAVLDGSALATAAWVLGTALGAAAGLALGRERR